MGFADLVFVYVYKSFVRLLHFFASIRWGRASASLLNCELVVRATGCPFVKISYQVQTSQNVVIDQAEIPFYLYWFAKRYAEKCVSRHTVIVRVHPSYTSVTRFFEFDQK